MSGTARARRLALDPSPPLLGDNANMEYIGVDLHQRFSQLCVLDAEGQVVETARVATTRPALRRWFGRRSAARICLETSGSSPWVDALLRGLGHEVVVCNPRRVRLIAESTLKNDAIDAETLARLVRIDPTFLRPIVHRGEEVRVARGFLRVRLALIKNRTASINAVRGILRSFGYRLPKGHPSAEKLKASGIPDVLADTVEPLVVQVEELTAKLDTIEAQLQELGKVEPVELMCGIDGVGVVTALSFMYCIEDPARFRRSRDVGAYLGLRPSLRESGERSNQGRITKQGDAEMRRLLVQCAHAVLRSKKDSDLKRWGERLAARVGKKKALVGLARKLAVLMHYVWANGVIYEPLHPKGAAVA